MSMRDNPTFRKLALSMAFVGGISGVFAPTNAHAGGFTDLIGDIMTAPAKISERAKNMGEEAKLYGEGVLAKQGAEVSKNKRKIAEDEARALREQAKAAADASKAQVVITENAVRVAAMEKSAGDAGLGTGDQLRDNLANGFKNVLGNFGFSGRSGDRPR